jgi:hypothetical protein
LVLPYTFLMGPLWLKSHLREMAEIMIMTIDVTDYTVGVNEGGLLSQGQLPHGKDCQYHLELR